MYSAASSFGVTLRSALAILFTAAIRSAICSSVKPSGKTILSGFGGGATVGAGGGDDSRSAPKASEPQHADRDQRREQPDERDRAPRAQLPAARRAGARGRAGLLAHAR